MSELETLTNDELSLSLALALEYSKGHGAPVTEQACEELEELTLRLESLAVTVDNLAEKLVDANDGKLAARTEVIAMIRKATAEIGQEERVEFWAALQEGYCFHCGCDLTGTQGYCINCD